MESSSFTNHQSSGKVEEIRDWKELPRDLMVTILVKLSHVEVLRRVQFVCKSWYETCKDPAVWRKIYVNGCMEYIESEEYEKMCFNAIDRSCGYLVEILFEFYGNDPLLLHMAQLSSQLRCLRIDQRCNRISDRSLREAIEKLPLLEEIDLTLSIVSDITIRSIGQYCRNLVLFKLHKPAIRKFIVTDDDDSDAIAIAETMPAIRHLQLIGNTMTNKGLQAILDSCSCLESLDIRACFQVDLSGNLGKRCADIMVKDGGCSRIWIECSDESEFDYCGDGIRTVYEDSGDESEYDEFLYR